MSTETSSISTPTAAAPSEPDTASSADSLLFMMGGAMFVVTVLACALIVEGTMAWLFAAYGGLLGLVAVVWVFLTRFIDAEH